MIVVIVVTEAPKFVESKLSGCLLVILDFFFQRIRSENEIQSHKLTINIEFKHIYHSVTLKFKGFHDIYHSIHHYR